MDKTLATATQPVRLVWELKTEASVDHTWEVLSDTDHFNRVAELGFHFEEKPQPDGTTLRIGHMRRLGMALQWQDLPFQYRTPEWFRKERIFDSGPAAGFVVTLRLKPDGKGTSIRYTVETYPRHALLRPLVALENYLFTRRSLNRTFAAVLAHLRGETVRGYDLNPPPLDAEASRRLKQGLQGLKPEAFARGLEDFILNAPLREQDRLQPVRQARRWGIPLEQGITGMLQAVQKGLLSLRWDVICPSCRMPKRRVESLLEVAREAHCDSCNVRFDGSFPDAVEVSFRTSDAIRRFDVQVACLGSPGRQPHITAQERIEPGGEAELKLPLGPGAYRLRSWPPREGSAVEVAPVGKGNSSAVTIMPFDFQPARLSLTSGEVSIQLKNVTDRQVEVILEQRWRPSDLLTAGKLLELPAARALLPGGAIPPGFSAELTHSGVVVIEVLKGGNAVAERIQQELVATSPRQVHRGDLRLIAVYPSFEAALAVARPLAANEHIRVAINCGLLLDRPLDASIPPMGSVIDDALACLRGAGRQVLAIPEKTCQQPEVDRALARGVGTLVPPDYQMPGAEPAMWIKFG